MITGWPDLLLARRRSEWTEAGLFYRFSADSSWCSNSPMDQHFPTSLHTLNLLRYPSTCPDLILSQRLRACLYSCPSSVIGWDKHMLWAGWWSKHGAQEMTRVQANYRNNLHKCRRLIGLSHRKKSLTLPQTKAAVFCFSGEVEDNVKQPNF